MPLCVETYTGTDYSEFSLSQAEEAPAAIEGEDEGDDEGGGEDMGDDEAGGEDEAAAEGGGGEEEEEA